MKRLLTIAVLLVFSAFLATMIAGFHFGAPLKSDMDDYFIQNGQVQTATNNQCTSVTFDFRGFDTLGESTVLFTAVIGVALMFRQFRGGEEDADE